MTILVMLLLLLIAGLMVHGIWLMDRRDATDAAQADSRTSTHDGR